MRREENVCMIYVPYYLYNVSIKPHFNILSCSVIYSMEKHYKIENIYDEVPYLLEMIRMMHDASEGKLLLNIRA